ncbi:MAG: hypothetical protein Q7U14_04285 [Lacisediminimonas sp.]|nr:hypothetical protein [Lacisediminimonas sp.]
MMRPLLAARRPALRKIKPEIPARNTIESKDDAPGNYNRPYSPATALPGIAMDVHLASGELQRVASAARQYPIVHADLERLVTAPDSILKQALLHSSSGCRMHSRPKNSACRHPAAPR